MSKHTSPKFRYVGEVILLYKVFPKITLFNTIEIKIKFVSYFFAP